MTAVMKIYFFWDIISCSLLKVHPCFNGTHHPIYRVEEIQGRNQHEAGSK
jgi:hypothetical protein